MREKMLLGFLGQMDKTFVEEADPFRGKKSKRHRSRRAIWTGVAAAAIAVAVLCSVLFLPYGGGVGPVAAASYEPDYSAKYDGTAISEEYLSDIREFAAKAGAAMLDGEDTTAYSPTALYTALSMVSELADGSSREALLDVLGVQSVEELRQFAADLWRYLCTNPDMEAPGKVTVANSMWLNQDYAFRGETLQNLADHYYVASYTGDMARDIPKMVSDWVKKQTNDLLDCQVEPDGSTLAILLSAIYFYDEWAEVFNENATVSGWFWSGEEKVDCNYMKRGQADWNYFQGDGVTASVQYFKNGGKMLFILPDEGSTPTDVLKDSARLSSLFHWEQLDKSEGRVEWLIPRFTLSKTIDLEKSLTELGLGELFDSSANPLPFLSEDKTNACIGHAEQGTAISIDEKGCEAASYVEIEVTEGTMELDEKIVEMYLTRPFVFAVLSENDVPLFLGVVNNPNG